MIIYRRKDNDVVIPCGLGPVVCPDTSHNLQMKTVDSSTVLQQVEPDSGYYGLYRVIVNPIYDANLLAENIKEGVEILGVMGTYAGELINIQNTKTVRWSEVPYLLQWATFEPDEGYDAMRRLSLRMPKTFTQYVTPSTSAQSFRPQNIGYDYYRGIEVSAVTADIDPDIQPENIKKDVEILGVIGTYEGAAINNQSKTVNSSTSSQTVTYDSSYTGLSSVTVNPYTVEGKSQTITQNGTYTFAPTSADALSDVSISVQVAGTPATVQAKSVSYNVNGEYTVTPDQGYDGLSSVDISVNVPTSSPALQTKTVNSSTASQTVQSDGGYDGLSEVIVNPYVLDSKTVNPSTNQQVVTSDEDGLSSVTVNAMTLQSKDYNEIGTYGTYYESIRPDNGYDGLSEVRVLWPAFMPLNVNSSTSRQVFYPAAYNKNYFNSVAVEPYTVETNSSTLTQNGQYTFSPVNADALSSVTVNVSVDGQIINNQSKTVNSSTSTQIVNFDSGYTGLSTVTVNPYTLDTKTVNPSINSITVNSSADGMSSVTVNAVTASIDPDIQAGNIKKDVEILGVVGTYEGTAVNNQNKTVDSSTISQTITSDSGYTGLGTVTVNPYTVETNSSTLTANGTYTITPQNADALSSVTIDVSVDGQVINNQNKTVDPSTSGQTITADSGYTGLGTVTVNPVNAVFGTYTITQNGPYGFDGRDFGGDYIDFLQIDVSVGSSGGDWYTEWKLGNKHDLSDVDLTQVMNSYQGACANMFATINNSNSSYATEAASSAKYITNLPIMDASLVHGYGMFNQAFAFATFTNTNQSGTGLEVSFPNLTNINGSLVFYRAFYKVKGDGIRKISFPELESLGSDTQGFAQSVFTEFFSSDNPAMLEEVYMPKFKTVYGGEQGAFNFTNFVDDPSGASRKLTVHVDALQYRETTNANVARYFGNSLTTLVVNGTATHNVYITSCPNISADSVLSVLQSLGTSGSGLSVNFASGLTVTDNVQGNIQTAYNTAVSRGWTINNLTITPYSA